MTAKRPRLLDNDPEEEQRYFQSYEDLQIHEDMLRDVPRTKAYQ
jgi:hypothetical protein